MGVSSNAAVARAFRAARPTSTMDAAVSALRESIIRGDLAPGERLVESSLTASMGISRNTIREVFRLLETERLVSRETNRGVFVRSLTESDIRDVYLVRRLVEVSSMRAAGEVPGGLRRTCLAEMGEAVSEGRAALVARDQWAAGVADLRFHVAVARLSGSPRLVELMSGLKAELRLAFASTDRALDFHAPYVERNATMLDLLSRGEFSAAAEELADYLGAAEDQLLARFAGLPGEAER